MPLLSRTERVNSMENLNIPVPPRFMRSSHTYRKRAVAQISSPCCFSREDSRDPSRNRGSAVISTGRTWTRKRSTTRYPAESFPWCRWHRAEKDNSRSTRPDDCASFLVQDSHGWITRPTIDSRFSFVHRRTDARRPDSRYDYAAVEVSCNRHKSRDR